MEVPDATGNMIKPFIRTMLPSMLQAKVDHSSFAIWKAILENNRGDLGTFQFMFLREAHKNFGANHDLTSKFRTVKQ
eukprot:8932690-Ditylum_brightwellii.AAC.2